MVKAHPESGVQEALLLVLAPHPLSGAAPSKTTTWAGPSEFSPLRACNRSKVPGVILLTLVGGET